MEEVFLQKSMDYNHKRLPRGVTSLPREVVDEAQKSRIIQAITEIVAEKGYANATIADIIKFAKVSKSTFYQLFKDKEDCFISGFRLSSTDHINVTLRSLNDNNISLKYRLFAALNAYIDKINDEFSAALAYIAEAESATPKTRAVYCEVQVYFVAALQSWLAEVGEHYPFLGSRAEIDFSLMMSGLSGHLVSQVRSCRKFTENDVQAIHRYMMACLGLYEWAEERYSLPLSDDKNLSLI